MITIEDVAREAGVSVASVSRVMSGARSVRPKTRTAVLAAAEKLGYQTNYFASALRRRSTSTIGMVVPHIANPFFIELVEKVENHVQGHGFDIFLCDSQNNPVIEAQRIRALMARQVDGIVLICADEVESRNSVLTAKDQVPVIVLDREIREIALDRIAVDNESGIKMIVEHLVRAGSRRLAFVGANERISTAHDRLQAYRKAVDAVGVGSRDDVMLGAFSVEWGREAGLAIAKRAERPDAVVCANDLIAVGVMRGLKVSGLRIPDDVAVTGFDDIALCRYVDPGITTIRQPIDVIAQEAADILMARIQGARGTVRNLLLGPELVIRNSSRRGA